MSKYGILFVKILWSETEVKEKRKEWYTEENNTGAVCVSIFYVILLLSAVGAAVRYQVKESAAKK